MEKINVAELLKDCPMGMELNCVMFEDVVFDRIANNKIFTIYIKRDDGFPIALTKYGEYSNHPSAKCIIFPKGKTTWDGFVPPCKFNSSYKFNNGDIIYVKDKYNQEWCSIFNYYENDKLYTYVDLCLNDNMFYHGILRLQCNCKDMIEHRLATEKEKERLFNAIKDNNYKLNAENKIPEEVIKPKFHTGEWVVFNNQPNKWNIYQIKNIHNYKYILQHILGGSMPISFSNENMLRLWTIDDAKDGDIICYKDEISIYKHNIKNCTTQENIFGGFVYYCCYDGKRLIIDSLYSLTEQDKMNIHPATKEQRNLLFTEIKDAGYRWDKKTKTFKEVIKPEFRVGNVIRLKSKPNYVYTVFCLAWDDNEELAYKLLPNNDKHLILVNLNKQDEYELVPSKFDINTLIPFESKVLVRNDDVERWHPTFWGFYNNNDELNYPYECVGNVFAQCIPYEGNEHLIGTKNKCDDFYKTWN